MPSARRRYAIIGTGHRSEMFLRALLEAHPVAGDVVAFLDSNPIRMDYFAQVAADAGHTAPIARYRPTGLTEMFDLEALDTVIVTSPDYTHADYIVAALDRGIDVVVEKPMTVDAESARRIADAAERSTAELTVTFNYRYSPRNSAVRQLIQDGVIGDVTSVHFEWCLDTVHGADYFRRWHREKAKSGGLLVHKSTHHFDLVNWWLGDVPKTVFALGGLKFYGAEAAAARGIEGRTPLSRDHLKANDPFDLDLTADARMVGLYLAAEKADGYQRDRDVFSDGITIEDNLTVAVNYEGGPSLAYTLVAHSPWEGYRVAINGTKGRIDLEVVERGWVSPTTTAAGIVDPSLIHEAAPDTDDLRPEGTTLLLQRLWEKPTLVEVPDETGAHGGGDEVLLRDIFVGDQTDYLGRKAGYLDGIRSIIVGIAGNKSLASGAPVQVADFDLPVRAKAGELK